MTKEFAADVEELKGLLTTFSHLIGRLESINGFKRRSINDICAPNIKYRIENLKYHTSKLTEHIDRAESCTHKEASFGSVGA